MSATSTSSPHPRIRVVPFSPFVPGTVIRARSTLMRCCAGISEAPLRCAARMGGAGRITYLDFLLRVRRVRGFLDALPRLGLSLDAVASLIEDPPCSRWRLIAGGARKQMKGSVDDGSVLCRRLGRIEVVHDPY